ncbi:MAG TPA: hypothetical protein VJN89_05000 [Candidatus Acidoferrum sp.]|nr:hypothetical protein [Candidatus Acidoferrum sp.]
MERSGWITGTIVVQGLWAGALVALTVFLLVYALTTDQEAASGLKIAAIVLSVPALLAALSWYGLWKKTLWGWWLALLTDTALMAMFIYSMIDDGLGSIDWEMAGLTVISAIVPVFLLIPAVTRFYWHATKGPASELP